MIKIQLICSACTRNDYYYGLIEKTAKELGLQYTLEKVPYQEQMKEDHLFNRCTITYCRGCNNFGRFGQYGDPSAKYMPALVINDETVSHSCVPSKDELKNILLKYLA
ncbi:MAG: hypothetical protein VB084_11120 [Syntrophomonadaceae bacterium]|nr:hypothetical protein [Syntrophomonadaceae bacterium]